MTEEQNQELYEMARLICKTGRHINTAFGERLRTIMHHANTPDAYARYVNDHANHTATMTKLIYMLKTWEEL